MKRKLFVVSMLMLLIGATVAWGEPIANEVYFEKKTTLAYPATYTLKFSLWNAGDVGAGDSVWEEDKTVTITSALIKTNLGDVTPLDPADFTEQLWVQVERKKKDGTYVVLGTRDKLRGSPYALWPVQVPVIPPAGTLGIIKTTNVRINGENNQAHISPGATFTVAFDFNYTLDGCPGCIAQLYVGLSSDLSGPQACPYSDVPGGSPGATGQISVSLTAPTTHGVYYVGYGWSLEYYCFGWGGTNWPNPGPPVTNDRVIGSISVY
jgi:hypothetical protein